MKTLFFNYQVARTDEEGSRLFVASNGSHFWSFLDSESVNYAKYYANGFLTGPSPFLPEPRLSVTIKCDFDFADAMIFKEKEEERLGERLRSGARLYLVQGNLKFIPRAY